jgi:hypothetical protein
MWPMTVVNICLLRANPQDLPTSSTLTVATILFYYAADIVAALAWVPLERAWVAATADTFLLCALAHLALKLHQRLERVRQTLMALAGCGAVFALVATLVGSVVPDGPSSLYVSLPALFWLLAVYGHILRHALEVPYAVGVVATGAYVFLSSLAIGPFLTPAASGG